MKRLLLLTAISASVLLAGCKDRTNHDGHQHAGHVESSACCPSEHGEHVAAAVAEQTTCPVMGGPINKELYTEYQGKKVYFCCAGCETEFNKNPEKYLPKLPQFAN